MNEEYNLHPYHNQTDSLAQNSITPLMIESLRKTKPWVRFMSIIMFISVAFMFLGGLLMFVSSTALGMRGASFGPLVGILYWIFGGLYLIPAIFSHRYASSIGDLLSGGGDTAMEMALESQKSVWKFFGITTLVVISIYALIILFAIFGAIGMMSLR
jgi:hypothetical protein